MKKGCTPDRENHNSGAYRGAIEIPIEIQKLCARWFKGGIDIVLKEHQLAIIERAYANIRSLSHLLNGIRYRYLHDTFRQIHSTCLRRVDRVAVQTGSTGCPFQVRACGSYDKPQQLITMLRAQASRTNRGATPWKAAVLPLLFLLRNFIVMPDVFYSLFLDRGTSVCSHFAKASK